MKMYTVLAGAAALVLAVAQSPDYELLWNKFKSDYDKSYLLGSSEEEERFQVFKTNVDIITTENAKGLSYRLGINQFADLTLEEFAQKYASGVQKNLDVLDLPRLPFPNINGEVLPDTVDWVAKGAVTRVKNQARCGSCWAFSATGALEGAYQIASGKLVSLSEEELVECDHNGDAGCRGGVMDNAFSWIKENGICTESAYPYTSGGGVEGQCNTTCKAAITLTGMTKIPNGHETALKAAVAKNPVSIAIEAGRTSFQLYSSGVLDNPACGKNLSHAVLIVGYGTEDGSGTEDGKDYWTVKNSWGSRWGEDGYVKIVRGKNMCGVAEHAVYPTGVKAAHPGPSPGPSPPSPPSPSPSPGSSHYEDPKDGCQSDEQAVTLEGLTGTFCSPACSGDQCPTDVPNGVTAQPQCALQDSASHKKYCALVCAPGSNDGQCGTATCKTVQPGIAFCLYEDVPSPGPSPPSPPSPLSPPSPSPPSPPSQAFDCNMAEGEAHCVTKAVEGCHWCKILNSGSCLQQNMDCPQEIPDFKKPVETTLNLDLKSTEDIVV